MSRIPPSPRRPAVRPRRASAAATRPQAVALLTETFRRDGYDGASLATLSQATGLGKSSLYHYFPGGKVEMAHAVLDFSVDAARRHVFSVVAAPGPPAERLRELLRRMELFFERGTSACILGRLSASVDRDRFREPLTRIFKAQRDAIARLLVEAGVPRPTARARAEDTVISIQGALVLSSGTGDPAPFQRMMARLRRDLLAPVHRTGR